MVEAAAATARFRAEYRVRKIGRWYSGWLHLAFTTFGSLAVVAFAVSRVRQPSWKELLVLPIGFLVANAAESFGHKGPMHPLPPSLESLFPNPPPHPHPIFSSLPIP